MADEVFIKACGEGNLSRVKELKTEINRLAFQDACMHGHLKVAQWLVTECKVDPNQPGIGGMTPLHWACTNGHLEVVKWLVKECKADPNQQSKHGCTALFQACLDDRLDIVKWLVIECKTDLDVTDKPGVTCRDRATGKVAEWLLSNRQ